MPLTKKQIEAILENAELPLRQCGKSLLLTTLNDESSNHLFEFRVNAECAFEDLKPLEGYDEEPEGDACEEEDP